jgi:hypothetical protein
MAEKVSNKLFLELGQIIQLDAPTNIDINKHIYFINYLDDNLIKLIDESDLSEKQLFIRDGEITDETIESISILKQPTEKGYARQNDLTPGNWITIEFGGAIPSIINGEITNLEEDMIEITTLTKQVLYIDFEYKGIPLDLPINSIREFKPPEQKREEELGEEEEEEIDLDEELPFIDELEYIDVQIDSDAIKENVSTLFINIDDIEVSDESLGEISEEVYVDEEKRRYAIETQTSDLLDELLSEYPEHLRTRNLMNTLHISIERFQQLRRKFSTFDEVGNAENIIRKGADYKPLIKNLKKLKKKLYWILPIVKNRHKLYDIDVGDDDDEFDDILSVLIRFDLQNAFEIYSHIKANTVPDGQNKYNYFYNHINDFLTPFIDSDDKTNIITKMEVNENLNVIIDNLEDFYATMLEDAKILPKKEESIVRKRFVIDKYNLGLNKLHNPDIKNKQSRAHIEELTPNDKLSLKGFLTLDACYLQYSKINLPMTSIYEKSKLNNYVFLYSDLFKEDTPIDRQIITEDGISSQNNVEFLNKKREYSFKEIRNYVDRESETTYEEFLNNIIPKTRDLFNLIKKYVKNGTSYIKVIAHLEPFLIYNDDISFKQYQEIIEFIEEEIMKQKETLIKNDAKFSKYLKELTSYHITTILPKLVNRNFQNLFTGEGYNFNPNLQTDLSIKKIISYDNGRAFNNALTISQLSFSQPINIEEKISEELRNNQLLGEEKDNDCGEKIYLAKRYVDIEELEADNNQELIFVDKKYDQTPYDIGRVWLEENEMGNIDKSEKDIIEKLSLFLQENNGVEKSMADRDSKAMVMGKRLVEKGDYAILEIGVEDLKYYIRERNRWKLNKSMSGEHVENINFCNVKKNCIKIKDACKNLESSKDILKKNLLDDITKRFEEELILNLDELRQKILDEYQFRHENLANLKKLKISQELHREKLYTKIANTLEEREFVISPYEELRDVMLSQTDIVKKMSDIQLFYQKFCREANDDENGYWYYCIDKDVPLLPTYFYDLSIGFNMGKYKKTIERICKERGEKSDDGDKWVDKHSGFYITEIAFDLSEGYDESGYRIVTREIMEASTQSKMSDVKIKKFNYETKLAKQIKKNVLALDSKTNLQTKQELDFIVRLTIDSLNKYLMSEADYRKLLKNYEKKGKKKKSYERAHDEILIYSLISAYIIAIQSAVPFIPQNAAKGNCKRSFTGFPLDNNSDLTCIEYISCISLFLKSNDRPWNILPTAVTSKGSRKKNFEEKMSKFVEKIKQFMETKIVNDFSYVHEKMEIKRQFVQEKGLVEFIPQEYDVQNWTTFLPPLTSVKVTKIQKLGPEFVRLIKKTIKDGSFLQYEHLWVLYGRILSYSMSIIESVQRIIDKQPIILKTKAGEPFMENACCNEEELNTRNYFSNKDVTINKHNEIIEDLELLYKFYKNSTKPPIFNMLKDTKIQFPKTDYDFSKTTIYLAFIKFCKFNSGVVLDEDLQRVCVNNTVPFKSTFTLEEKMELMENNGLKYGKDSLNVLLNIVNKKNIIDLNINKPIITEKVKIEGVVEYLLDKDDIFICNRSILEKMKNILDRFDVTIMEDKNDDITDIFTRDLDNVIDEQLLNIQEKLLENNVLTDKIKNLLVEFISDKEINNKVIKEKQSKYILNWELQGDNLYISQKDETGYKIFSLLKNMTIDICKTLPTMILNQVNVNNRYVPKHWKLKNKRHPQDIMNIMMKDYEGFSRFYGDPYINKVLEYVKDKSDDLLMLLNAIPFYAGILEEQKMGSIFDGDIVKKIGYYIFLCAISIYLSSFDVDLELEEKKTNEEDDDILLGQHEELEKTTCQLLITYFKKLLDYKKTLNLSSEQIKKNVRKSKEKEKAKITVRLRDLTVEEREIENMMKIHSLGDWSLGLTRAIFEYDENQYDKERQEMETDALMELKMGDLDEVSKFNSDIFKFDLENQTEIDNRINNEVYDMSYLPSMDDDEREEVDYL